MGEDPTRKRNLSLLKVDRWEAPSDTRNSKRSSDSGVVSAASTALPIMSSLNCCSPVQAVASQQDLEACELRTELEHSEPGSTYKSSFYAHWCMKAALSPVEEYEEESSYI